MKFQNIKDWLNQQKTSAMEAVSRIKNKDFLDAVVAGCAIVAATDGSISAEEKRKMAGYIERSEELKSFEIKDVIQRFNGFVDSFEFDAMIGKGEALKAIRKIKNNPEWPSLLISVCCAIGMADGEFDDQEKEAVRGICKELDLDPSDFGL